MKTKQPVMINRIRLLVPLVLISMFGNAQTGVVDTYIQEAFSNNEGLKQQQFQLERSMYALKEAKSLFMPSVNMLGSYTRAKGGRTIDMPIGDLLNPVYTTLNELTQSNSFPQVENAEVQLSPDNFYDAKLRAMLPLVNAEIYYNNRIRKELVTQQQAAMNVYKRELVKEVRTAYYHYVQAIKAIDIYDNAIGLLDQNIKMNQSLVKNGVRNSTALSRAETEKQKTNADRNKVINDSESAKAYFNFLLNRPLNSDIVIDTTIFNSVAAMLPDTNAVLKREELQQLSSFNNVLGYSNSINRSYLVPKLSLFADAGSQGFEWKFDDKTRYIMVGLNFEWNLFASGRYRYKAKQSEAELNTGLSQYKDVENKLQLQYLIAYNTYKTAVANYGAAQAQSLTAKKYYSDQLKAYKEGMILYIELLDAQNQLTISDLQLNIAQADILNALAGIERCTASYNLNTK